MDVAAIQTDCSNHGFSDISTADFLVHLNDAYQDINSLEAWPYLEKTLSTSFAATAAQFAAVTDIKQVLSIINTQDGYALTPVRADVFYKDYANALTQTNADPYLYYTAGVNATAPNGLAISVWPVPAIQTCQLRYLYIPPMFTLTTDIPVIPQRFHRILTWATLMSLYQMEDDTDASGRMQMLMDRHLARMRDDLWSQNYDRNDTIADVGDDSEGNWL